MPPMVDYSILLLPHGLYQHVGGVDHESSQQKERTIDFK